MQLERQGKHAQIDLSNLKIETQTWSLWNGFEQKEETHK